MAVSASQHVVADARHEELLLAELASGDRDQALAGLYAAYGRRIYRLGLVLLRDDGLAEDLVQETFVRLWRSAHRYDASRGSVRSFVLTLARRAAVDLWRRRERALLDVHDGREREDVQSGKAFADAVLRLDLREALDELSPAHREVLELQYSRDLTQAQVAARLDIPLGTVKSRTLYALRALAHRLSERDLRG